MLKIWGRTNSGNVQKALWAADELGLKFERIDAGMAYGKVNEDWYLKMNPNARVPVIDDDGFILYESNVIVRYLCAKHGKFYPQDVKTRAVAEQWMDWQQTTIGPTITPVFWGLVRTPPEKRDMKAVGEAAVQLGRLYQQLDAHLAGRDFVAGREFSMGDIPLGTMTYRFFAMDIERPHVPNLKRWYERLLERPPYREHVVMPLN
jgi:glutathione S-transferase